KGQESHRKVELGVQTRRLDRALAKLEIGQNLPAPRLLDHFGRSVETNDLDRRVSRGDEAREPPRPAADVEQVSARDRDLRGDASIKRLEHRLRQSPIELRGELAESFGSRSLQVHTIEPIKRLPSACLRVGNGFSRLL